MRRIIVGFDGSTFATDALRWAVTEARRHAAELVALTVIDDQPAPIPTSTHQPPVDPRPDVLADLRAAVSAAVDGFPAVFRYTLGSAAAELIAASRDADLLVVGSRGRGRFTNALLGSVSRACLMHAPGPVVVVRPNSTRQMDGRVVVGVDGSEASRAAIRVAATEARLRRAELQAVHAVHWDRIGTEFITPTDDQLVEWGTHLVHQQLADLHQHLTEAGVEVQPVIVPGHPGDVLVDYSRTADLLVLGSRGHNPLTSLLLGSTSDYCAHHATCPVMVVRSPDRAPEGPASTGAAPGTSAPEDRPPQTPAPERAASAIR
jgi:nucleotide-binding universal stress UspA family protein